MTIRHHPSDETILAFANGSLAETLSLVVAAHLDGCARRAAGDEFLNGCLIRRLGRDLGAEAPLMKQGLRRPGEDRQRDHQCDRTALAQS